jgi:hypothetical protein
MILRLLRSAALLLALISLAIPWAAQAKKDGPRITAFKFDNILQNLFYFDDSNVILGHDREAGTVWRSADAGENWNIIDGDDQAGNIWDLWRHPFDKTRAYMLGMGRTHWMTNDRGETWRRFETEATTSLFRSPFSFHGHDPKKVIWHGQICHGFDCDEAAYYTDNDFKTVNDLKGGSRGCHWAASAPRFGKGIEPVVDNRIFCIVRGFYSPWPKDNRLLVSDDFFETESEPVLDDGRTVTGIIEMAPVSKYMLAAAKAQGTDELALYVTDDSVEWHRAEFGNQRINEEAYTILESTNYSIQIDVLNTNPKNPMGVLFTSNSNGTYFTRNIEYTNRNVIGNVDFEKVQGIQGIVLVNTVKNGKEVESGVDADKQVVTEISFDDGRTFQELTVDGERLHLHSVTDLSNSGRVFSSPAPGIVMGIGNTGKSLKTYEEGDLYISDDAGLTWREGLNGAHKYEFGNGGGVVVAINDEEATSEIQYSINHGKDWATADLPEKVRAQLLTTVRDSTTLKFLLMGKQGSGSKAVWYVFMIDFAGLHERTCKDDDFIRWPARVDKDGKPSCLMGHKQFYRRRKADAECFIEGEFMDPKPEFERCTCTKQDFECDFNFVRSEDRTRCVPSGPLTIPDGACKDPEGTFRGSSGWRLIPGNECIRKGGEVLDQEIERPCKDSVKTPVSGEVAVEKTFFDAARFGEWHYLERTKNSPKDETDETLVMRTSEQEIYLTRDHGKTWTLILEGEPITQIVPHTYFNDVVYFLTGSEKVYYSINRAEKISSFYAPAWPSELSDLPTIRFHPDYKDWLLWAGSDDCPGADCHTNIHYSKDRGDDWSTLLRYVRKCEFIKKEGVDANENLVYCEQYQDEDPNKPLQLISSDNWFADSNVHFPDILDFATMSEFIIVAAKTEDQKSLKVDASVDGHTFAAAEFPPNFKVAHQQAYTVLDSSTHAVFLHVTVNNQADREYGTIIKSNSNGTSYVLTLSAVNRDNEGYVDFEKMQGLEGVALVNVVANAEQTKENAGEKKKLKSMITHNDGAEWAFVPPPKKDAVGGDFACVKNDGVATEKCSLHIHSYTERYDKGATFSSPSAVGLMMAVGNVGEYLERRDSDNTDTFITRDGGITWSSVKRGSYMWEYGDQGSIIVIVEESKPTKFIFYTLDEGRTWVEYEFSSVTMQIDAITTVPSDTSLNFLLWGREVGDGAKSGIATVNLDFTSLKERQRQCDLSETVTENEDYYFWEPRHPMQPDNCLFGHVRQYHRKKPKAQCFNGREIQHGHPYAKNCSCTRQDFEWYVCKRRVNCKTHEDAFMKLTE